MTQLEVIIYKDDFIKKLKKFKFVKYNFLKNFF